MSGDVRLVTVLLGALGCAYMASSVPSLKDDLLEIKDDAGRVRIRIGHLGDDEYGTVFFDAAGVIRGRLSFVGTANETRYEIRDDQGQVSAMMFGTNNGTALVQVGSDAIPRAQLAVQLDGSAGIDVFDSHGRGGATMYVSESGDMTTLKLLNPSEGEHSNVAAMQVSKQRAAMAVRDASQTRAVILEQVKDSYSQLMITEDGQDRLVFGVRKAGGAGINLLNEQGKLRVTVEETTRGAGVGVLDADGTPRASLGVNSDGNPSLKVRDKEGKVLLEVPGEEKKID